MKLDTVACPKCSQTNLHHDRVEVFERAEDADIGIHVVVSGGDTAWDDSGNRTPVQRSATVDACMDGNPSSRRQGLLIWFWCECCGERSRMTIAQHKGATYVELKSQTQLRYDEEDRELMRGMSAAQKVRFLLEKDKIR